MRTNRRRCSGRSRRRSRWPRQCWTPWRPTTRRGWKALPLSETEFRAVVWPELPSSRPDRGLPFDYAWGDLHQKSNNALRRLIAREAGRRYDLLAVEFDGESTPYDTYTVHRESRLVVRGADGTQEQVRLFGSILERSGAYKLFSYVVD